MTLKDLEREIWIAKGHDKRAVEIACSNAAPHDALEMEIPPECIAEARRRLTAVIDEVIREGAKLRKN